MTTKQMELFEAPNGKPKEISIFIRSLDPAANCGNSLAMGFQ